MGEEGAGCGNESNSGRESGAVAGNDGGCGKDRSEPEEFFLSTTLNLCGPCGSAITPLEPASANRSGLGTD